MSKHQIRVTGVLLKDGKILLVKQNVDSKRGWSLPGGKVETGETLEEALVRELNEETGLGISVGRLLYVADKPDDNILHITFEVHYVSGEIQLPTNDLDINPISDVKFVDVSGLVNLGFTKKWQDLVLSSFADAPKYVGRKTNIGL